MWKSFKDFVTLNFPKIIDFSLFNCLTKMVVILGIVLLLFAIGDNSLILLQVSIIALVMSIFITVISPLFSKMTNKIPPKLVFNKAGVLIILITCSLIIIGMCLFLSDLLIHGVLYWFGVSFMLIPLIGLFIIYLGVLIVKLSNIITINKQQTPTPPLIQETNNKQPTNVINDQPPPPPPVILHPKNPDEFDF